MDQIEIRDELFCQRSDVSVYHIVFSGYRRRLPERLHPLFGCLNEMRLALIDAYRNYDTSFDGSSMLDVVPLFL